MKSLSIFKEERVKYSFRWENPGNIKKGRIEKADMVKMYFTLTVAEDTVCSGLPLTDEVVCFIDGILEGYTGNHPTAKKSTAGHEVTRYVVLMPECLVETNDQRNL
jgi:hypothetical protein